MQLISTLAVYRGNKANHSQVSVCSVVLLVDIPNCTLPRRRLSDLSIFENAGQDPENTALFMFKKCNNTCCAEYESGHRIAPSLNASIF